MKQVNRAHYEFEKYMSIERWVSVWNQVSAINKLEPSSVLEIGVGSGLASLVGKVAGLDWKTIDIDAELKPDFVGSIEHLPVGAGEFDTVCAFQVLEHLPYDSSVIGFEEMCRVAKRNVIISVPNCDRYVYLKLRISNRKLVDFGFSLPSLFRRRHSFDGEHYWELGKLGYSKVRFLRDLGRHARLLEEFRVPEFPYHHFFVFEKLVPIDQEVNGRAIPVKL